LKYIRPKVDAEVYEIFGYDREGYWKFFKKHHYLTSSLNKSSRCFLLVWRNVAVGFYSVLPQPSGTIHNAMRGHRLVVACDYQGMGFGTALSASIGDLMLKEGKRFFCKTANKKLGVHRNASSLWSPTSKNEQRRFDDINTTRHNYNNITDKSLSHRLCYSHEYVGVNPIIHPPVSKVKVIQEQALIEYEDLDF
jgi:hypothetical protein